MVAMEVSSPDKVLFPDDGITKAEVVDHYRRAAPSMLEFARGRPLTLQRFPRGIGESGFMQKNVADHFPPSIGRHRVAKRDGGETVYPVVTEPDDIAWLANQNTLTFHMWLSSADRPEHPEWLVIDLDPPEGRAASQVRSATRAVHEVLDELGLDSFVVATGSKGYHVWVPVRPGVTTTDSALATRAIAGLVAARHPDTTTTEFLKRERRGRVFVDWLRNTPTATTVVPYSLRPRPGAPVAMPLRWDELDDSEPDGWRLGAVDDRMDRRPHVAAQELSVEAIVAVARHAGVDLDTPHDRFGRRR